MVWIAAAKMCKYTSICRCVINSCDVFLSKRRRRTPLSAEVCSCSLKLFVPSDYSCRIRKMISTKHSLTLQPHCSLKLRFRVVWHNSVCPYCGSEVTSLTLYFRLQHRQILVLTRLSLQKCARITFTVLQNLSSALH